MPTLRLTGLAGLLVPLRVVGRSGKSSDRPGLVSSGRWTSGSGRTSGSSPVGVVRLGEEEIKELRFKYEDPLLGLK